MPTVRYLLSGAVAEVESADELVASGLWEEVAEEKPAPKPHARRTPAAPKEG